MDDNTKMPQSSPVPQVAQDDLSSQIAPAPVSPPKLKEQAPVGPAAITTGEKVAGMDVAESDKVAKEEGDEYWENYAREIELEKEVLEMGGVEKVESGEVKVSGEVAKEMGIRPTVEPQTQISEATGFSVRGVVLSDDQLALGLAKPTSSGWRWLVEWFIYQLLKARYHIRRVGGKIFRIKLETTAPESTVGVDL